MNTNKFHFRLLFTAAFVFILTAGANFADSQSLRATPSDDLINLTIGESPKEISFAYGNNAAANIQCQWIRPSLSKYAYFSFIDDTASKIIVTPRRETPENEIEPDSIITLSCHDNSGSKAKINFRINLPSAFPASAPLKIERQNEISPLSLALTKDDEANEDEDPWYLGVNNDEIVKVDIPDGYQLVSSRSDIVAIVNDKFLVGMGRRGEAVVTVKESGGKKASFPMGAGLTERYDIKVRITSNTDRKIIAVPRLKTYKAVRDEYGKGIAKNYIVVAVDITNSNPAKQFLVQNVSVSFDPNQCNGLSDVWSGVYGDKFDATETLRDLDSDENKIKGKVTDQKTKEVYTPESQRQECITQYIRYFDFPTTILPTDGNTMLAVASVEKYSSKRYRLFQAMRFVADVGGALPAFNILGREGRTAFNFLGNTLFNSADAALPKVSDEKRKNLENDVPKQNIIVKGNSPPEEINIFIPADRVFNKNSWQLYKKTVGNMERDDSRFKKYILLFLVANSNGILIDENSKQVDSKQGGGVKKRL